MASDPPLPADPGSSAFFRHWFDGFSRALERLAPEARETLLCECAAACGRSYTTAVFQRAWADAGGDLDAFLARLAGLHTAYERTGPDTFRLTWSRCGCDLVTAGLVRTPLLCRCSEHSLRQNLEAALGRSASVTMRSTILGGAERCVFEVKLGSRRD